jgi:hypothetical protein
LQGEAKSAQLIGEAISNNPAFITLRKIEASREIANTISTSQNRVFLSADSASAQLSKTGSDFLDVFSPIELTCTYCFGSSLLVGVSNSSREILLPTV